MLTPITAGYRHVALRGRPGHDRVTLRTSARPIPTDISIAGAGKQSCTNPARDVKVRHLHAFACARSRAGSPLAGWGGRVSEKLRTGEYDGQVPDVLVIDDDEDV